MFESGMSKPRIMLMWSSITVMTAVGASVGAAVVPAALTHDWRVGMACIEGLAGGSYPPVC
jgi:hypothetical protein